MKSLTVTLLVACINLTTKVLADDVVVLLTTSDTVDVQALKCVQGTAAVYSVKPIQFYTTSVYREKYSRDCEYIINMSNYMVLGKGFRSSEEETAYVNKISSFDFVESHTSIGLKVNPRSEASALNKYISKAPKESFLRRPLEQAPCSGCRCSCNDVIPQNTGENTKVFAIGLAKVGDREELKKHAMNLLLRVFPSLNIKYVYSADSKEEEFDALKIMEFVNKGTWCEYSFSKVVQVAIEKSFQAFAGFSAVEV